MPAHKNQHFVPRCALRPFSLNNKGTAINLFNIKSGKPVQNAPVKGQCARDYLYGKDDLETEKLLAQLEGSYSRIVAALETDGRLKSGDEEWLQLFVLFQHRRTEAAIRQMRDTTESMADKAFARAPEYRPQDDRTDSEIMQESLLHATLLVKYIKDLKVAVFKNKTRLDFVTSDNPAIMTNRFHFEKLKASNFGIANAGAIFSMPLSPRLSLICYDRQVYTLPNATGTPFVDVAIQTDVTAINGFQYLNANQNIYFKRWDDADLVKAGIATMVEIRAQPSSVSTLYVRDDLAAGKSVHLRDPGTGEIQKSRHGTAEEEATAEETIVTTSISQREPIFWPSKLKYRSKPRHFFNGTGIGHVRKPEWLHSRNR